MVYEKAMAELVLFDNFDVITTSGMDDTNTGDTGCLHPGWDRGNNCGDTSGKCPGQAWKA